MVTGDLVQEVWDLARRGASHRRIAAITGVSRASVQNILSRGEEFAIYRRCPTCGAKVILPCRACDIRTQSRSHDHEDIPVTENDFVLNIKGAAYRRYQVLHAQKAAQSPITIFNFQDI